MIFRKLKKTDRIHVVLTSTILLVTAACLFYLYNLPIS